VSKTLLIDILPKPEGRRCAGLLTVKMCWMKKRVMPMNCKLAEKKEVGVRWEKEQG